VSERQASQEIFKASHVKARSHESGTGLRIQVCSLMRVLIQPVSVDLENLRELFGGPRTFKRVACPGSAVLSALNQRKSNDIEQAVA
jgi:hypothetical protein